MSNNQITGKKVGVVSVHMYREITTNAPFFYIESENQEVLPISYLVEDTLKRYQANLYTKPKNQTFFNDNQAI